MRLLLVVLVLLAVAGCKPKVKLPEKLPDPCTKAWFKVVQSVSPVGGGHNAKRGGPEPGSKEWMGKLSKQLDIEAEPSDLGKRDWCKKVDSKLLRKGVGGDARAREKERYRGIAWPPSPDDLATASR